MSFFSRLLPKAYIYGKILYHSQKIGGNDISFAYIVKNKLKEIISSVTSHTEAYVKRPDKDFTRKRGLPLDTVIALLISMGGNSLRIELLEHTNYDIKTVTTSAFVQQRDKILPEAFAFILNEFTNSFNDKKTCKGHRLFAIDGSDLNIAHNPKDLDTYFQDKPDRKGYNQLHLNAMFDLNNKLYQDVIIQPGKKKNECCALTDMVDRSNVDGDVIVIADRGYEGYNVFAHIEQKGWKYLIRAKDIDSNGIAAALNLPKYGEFDKTVHITLTRKHTKKVRENRELYKFISSTTTFDYLDYEENQYYSLSLRVVRIRISDDVYETIITNLNPFQFPPTVIKELYHLRWGIESSFRELKYAIGLICFHSKTVGHIIQEIYAKLIMYNFCELITLNVVIEQKYTKHAYQVNFTHAILICVRFFRCTDNMPPVYAEALIALDILPVRPGRSDPRKVKPKSVVSFIYRVS